MINNIISCEFNIDTACVEVKLTDGSMVSIDCIAVENEYANNMYETSELDYLIYNEPTVEELSRLLGVDYSRATRLTGLLEIDGFISKDLMQRCSINSKIM